MTKPGLENLIFIDNPAAAARQDHYRSVAVDPARVLKSWRASLFSYEWMLPDGRLKSAGELPAAEQERRATAEKLIAAGGPVEKPILGIGLLENVEIGSGRATFLTLASLGAKEIPVHIPRSNADEFKPFLTRANEKGGAIFYILIAIAFLAALVFAVTQGMRGSGADLTGEKTQLAASEVISYADDIKKAVATLRLRGTAFSALDFDPTDTSAQGIFSTSGGGIIYKTAPDEVFSSGTPAWIFTAGNEVENVGTTCAGDDCADLLAVLPALTKTVCIKINNIIGVGTKNADPPVQSDIDVTAFTGTATYAETIDAAALVGKTAGCFQGAPSGLYFFYETLIPR